MNIDWFDAMVGQGCQKLLGHKVLSALLDQGEPFSTMVDVSGQLETIKNSSAYTFAGRESQILVNIVVEWAKSIVAL